MVVWDHNSVQINAAIYAPDGTLVYDDIIGFTNNNPREATVMAQADGGFVVAAINGNRVRTQRFSHNGEAIGSKQIINSATTSELSLHKQISLSELPGGHYVVGWTSSFARDGDHYSAMARVVEADGTPVSDEIILNQYTASLQQDVRLVILRNGGFMALWQSIGADGDSWGLMGRVFDANGQPATIEFRVSPQWQGRQFHGDIALLNDGRLAVAYSDNSSGLYQAHVTLLHPGTADSDVLRGNDGRNILLGLEGNNTLHGEAGNDLLFDGTQAYGGDGDDTFYGGHTLNGGNGNDRFNGPFDNGAVIDGGNDFDILVLSGNNLDHSVFYNGDGSYEVVDNRINSPNGTITLLNVEAIDFDDGRQTVGSGN